MNSRHATPGAILLSTVLVGGAITHLRAEEPQGAILYRQAMRVLEERCGDCHGSERPRARLDVTRPGALSAGDRKGPVIEPGNLDASRLWQSIARGQMPPRPAEPLSTDEARALREWIVAGAPGLPPPRRGEHWAFVPPTRPKFPKADASASSDHPIDRFVDAELAHAGLTRNPSADRRTLIRRVSFTLTGLPPSSQELREFLDDETPGAYERMVDRYLESPHYGERSAQHWLDAAGYADSNGYFAADTDRPLAYRYRDYVVRSFNDDKPYDQFVREQIAGDEIAGYRKGGDVTDDMIELLVATHFLRNAQDGTGESDGNPDEVRTDRYTVLEGTVHILTSSLLGLTFHCARCHDHKFEPLSQREYYAMQAVFFPGYNPDRWTKPNDRAIEVGTVAERKRHGQETARVDAEVKRLQTSLTQLKRTHEEAVVRERLASLPADVQERILAADRQPAEKRDAEQNALLKRHARALQVDDKALQKRSGYTTSKKALEKKLDQTRASRPPALEKLSVFIDTDSDPPSTTCSSTECTRTPAHGSSQTYRRCSFAWGTSTNRRSAQREH